MRLNKTCLIMILFITIAGDVTWNAGEAAPQFSLLQHGTKKQVSLNDFYGQIVILDFFSASCNRCLTAAWEIETGIQEFYKARSGNPHGIDVQVISINSDVSRPDDLSAFIEETGMNLVLENPRGDLLELYGGTTLPYLVIIDATGAEPEAFSPTMVYKQAGFDGVEKLYKIIDSINGLREQVMYDMKILPVSEADPLVTHDGIFDLSSLSASDVFVTETLAGYQYDGRKMDMDIAFSWRRSEVDYLSDYLINRREKKLAADRIGLQCNTRFSLDKSLAITAGAGFYDGYQTFRALWLNEYYRHIFDVLEELIGEMYGYKNARPRGYNISSGLRWEYLPDTGYVDAGISFQHDVVSPGYEMGVSVVRLRDRYNTKSGNLAFENVITRRLRTMAEFRIDDTTDRKLRFSIQGGLNYAMADNWVMRLNAGWSKENPGFRSKSISAVLERDWHGMWFVSLFGRYYEDTTEIDSAVLRVAAAPPLESYQAGMGLRRQGHSSFFKFTAVPCFTNYQRKPDRDKAFDRLYRDRDWLSVQFTYLHRF
ncbi:MAG: TlpA family protein disulfide reductase [Deltaproteobacteria bacterium]|nr:TlpA family protein disulfide reductase [Deltaproteobacteria bacterium]